ncbi:MAG: Rne/Rng family ribonuclease [Geobacteraceae bacterium]|nr:Rne/Rng family ribonuclease [Geobacteraceae bacterium]
MPRKMLINALHPEESRVAIVDENGRLVDLDIEIAGSEQLKGNIYKGVVLRVEPSLQAAFIDVGLKKPAFIQMGELHPDNWQWRDEVPEDQRKRRPRIQDVLRRGQELIVQIEKDERDMKGAAVTTYVSLPGRYMVLMPGSDSTGISRKVEGEGERKKLKELASQMTFREGVGYIIRTEAMGRSLEELQSDLDHLLAKYDEVVVKGAKTKGPAVLYKEYAVVIRTIRDYFSADIDEVLVDSKEVCKEAKAFFKETMPKFEKRVKMHQEKRPIFSRYQIEEQIDGIYEKKVPLKSGGSLVIEPTEALVSIDVNSGKSTGERNVEDTAFRTNLEAVDEAARQLRLRDLGGLIVLDLIDMREMKHIKEVEKALKDALKGDKARVTVGRISQFGMLEMSRQRIKQTLESGSILDCPHCSGRGKVKGVESMALSFLRKVHAAAAKGTAAEVRGDLPLEVAYYLLNRKKRELVGIENDYDIEVTIKGKPSFLMNQLELVVIKREKPLEVKAEVEVKVEAETKPEVKTVAKTEVKPVAKAEVKIEAEDETPADDGRPKKKRTRKKKGEPVLTEEAPVVDEVTVAPEEILAEALADTAVEVVEIVEAATEEPKKKKRRRRKKKKSASVEPVETVESTEAGEDAADEAEGEQPATGEQPAVEGEAAAEPHKKRRRRRKKRSGAKSEDGEILHHDEPVAAEPLEAAPVVEVPPVEASPVEEAKPVKKRRAAKKVEPLETAVIIPESPAEEPMPEAVKPKRTRAKKAAIALDGATVVPFVEESISMEEKPKPKRAPRKKKAES